MDFVYEALEWLFSRSLIEYVIIVVALVLIIREVVRLASAYRNRDKNGDDE
jgi:hypothetical protein